MMIITAPDKRLNTICAPVTPQDNITHLCTLLRVDGRSSGGVGLAAPQVGYLLRVVWVCTADFEGIIVNPVITKRSGKLINSVEGCLSIPDKQIKVKRDKRITVEGTTETGSLFKCKFRNFSSFVLQHEIDHLNGITLLNK